MRESAVYVTRITWTLDVGTHFHPDPTFSSANLMTVSGRGLHMPACCQDSQADTLEVCQNNLR